MQQISRDDVPDVPNRIVTATTPYLGVPVISRDGKIAAEDGAAGIGMMSARRGKAPAAKTASATRSGGNGLTG